MQVEQSRQNEALQLRGYIPGLDVLRGLAVGSVVWFHGFANAGFAMAGPKAAVVFVLLSTLGKQGIYLFFMLSGFLITTILLKERDQPSFYKNFYIRRALRILPAYLLVLVVLKVFGLVHWRFVLACLLFIANMAKLLHSSATEYGVLWTLAVEEQFYLLWPTVVRQLRRPRTLLMVLIAGCALAPLLRVGLSLFGISTYLLLPTNMDALLYGALCAVLMSLGLLHRGNIRRMRLRLVGAGVLLAVPYVYTSCFAVIPHMLFWVVWDGFGRFPLFCLFLAGLLLAVEEAQGAPPRRGLPARLLMFLGYISYGLYLVHPMIFGLYDHLCAGTALGGSRTHFGLLALRFVVVSAASVLAAAVSRRYYEQLFLRRKKQLAPYAGAVAATESLP